MTWKTNSVTFVECDDPRHDGDVRAMVETSYLMSARDAMKREGWGYDHATEVHICPTCVTRNITHPRGVPTWNLPSSN